MGLAIRAGAAVGKADNPAAVGRDSGVHRDALAGGDFQAIEPGHTRIIPYEERFAVCRPAINGLPCVQLRELSAAFAHLSNRCNHLALQVVSLPYIAVAAQQQLAIG